MTRAWLTHRDRTTLPAKTGRHGAAKPPHATCGRWVGTLQWTLGLLPLAIGGCAEDGGWKVDTQAGPPLVAPGEIDKIICLYQPPFFKSYDPQGDRDPEGFKFNMYLRSRKTGRGVLSTGVLQTRMYRRDPQPDGSVQRTEVCSWTQDLADVPCTTREFELGWAYVPHLFWGGADVLGREVEIVTWLEVPDGRKVYAQTQTTKVPARK